MSVFICVMNIAGYLFTRMIIYVTPPLKSALFGWVFLTLLYFDSSAHTKNEMLERSSYEEYIWHRKNITPTCIWCNMFWKKMKKTTTKTNKQNMHSVFKLKAYPQLYVRLLQTSQMWRKDRYGGKVSHFFLSLSHFNLWILSAFLLKMRKCAFFLFSNSLTFTK